MWEWDMLMLCSWCVLSIASAGAASKSLRKASIPFSDSLVRSFDVLISFLPLYSSAYAFNHYVLVEVDVSEMSNDPKYTQLRRLFHDGVRRLTVLAICTAILQYFCLSMYCIFFLAVSVGLMQINVVISDFCIHGSKLHLISVFPLLLLRKFSLKIMMILLPHYHVLLLTPYFRGLTTRSSMAARAYKQRKYMEIVCGMLTTALSTYYFRFQSTDLLLALLRSAVSFFYMFLTIKPSTDFGIIQFFVPQSIQCAVSVFGLLHSVTLLVLVFGCLLMAFRWNVESAHLLEPQGWGGKSSPVFNWILTLFAGQDLVLAAFEGYHPLYILGLSSLLLIVFMMSVVSGPCPKICQSIWQWYWHREGNLSIPLYYYVHFKEILHLLVAYFQRSKYDFHRDAVPPV